jgi:hypothetical protein
METDFSDVWFIDATTYRRCPHWVESYTSGTSAVMWIQTPANLSSVYMLFGESTVEDVSNGEQVFLLHDGFSGSSIDENKWLWGNNTAKTGSVTVSSGELTVTPNADATYDRNMEYIATRMLIRDITVIAKEKLIGSEGRYTTTGFGLGDAAGSTGSTSGTETMSYGIGCIMCSRGRNSDSTGTIRQLTGIGSYTTIGAFGKTHPSLDVYYLNEFIYTDGTIHMKNDGTSICSVYNVDAPEYMKWYAGRGVYDGQTYPVDRVFDWIGIREYVATEPTISIGTAGANPEYVGGEEPTYNLLVGFTGSNF